MNLVKAYLFVVFAIGAMASFSTFESEKPEQISTITNEDNDYAEKYLVGHIVSSADDQVIVDGKIKVIEDNTRKLHGLFKPNSSTGKFILTFRVGIEYCVVVSAPGHQTKISYFRASKEDDPWVEGYEFSLDPLDFTAVR